MPRSAIATLLICSAIGSPVLGAGAFHPHLDAGHVEGGCSACHEGHGLSGSPMLPAPQVEVCLGCHGSQSDADRQVHEKALSANARPQLLSSTLSLPYTHPLTDTAFSREEPGVVTCTSCHTPHKNAAEQALSSVEAGQRKMSTRNPNRFEVHLCQECHGSDGTTEQNGLDISLLTNPNSASYHPIESPVSTVSPSTNPDFSGAEINCTDCHGNSDPNGARGPHGSLTRHLLRLNYVTTDGSRESVETYALCYGCHDRQKLMAATSPFPLHELHVIQESASCATCHNPHGSLQNRSLIRFGEEAVLHGVSPSPGSGRLAFLSTAPRSGACFVMCHGSDHNPFTYGGEIAPFDTLASPFGTQGDGFGIPMPKDPMGIPRQPEKIPDRPPPGN